MVNWNDIDTVLLDMDGTLLDLHFDNHFWLEHLPHRYAEIRGEDPAEARHRMLERFRQEQGTLNWYCVDYWTRELGLDVAALKDELRHLIRIRPHVEDFLARLHAGHRRVLLVTNAHRKSLDLKMAHTGLERWFDAIVSSHDFGMAKEHDGFWDALRAVEPFDPARTLFIDDSLSVLESARRYGIRWLLCLLQPDSKREPRTVEGFPAILHFDEIMPDVERIDA
jgi:putative hydrolase of the HAD superfamily